MRRAPKVELHPHRDGAMSLTWLLERVRRPGVPSLRTVDALGARLRFRTFDEFIERWVWKCGFLDTGTSRVSPSRCSRGSRPRG